MKASVNRGGFLGETTKPQADDIRRIQALYGTSTGVGVVTTLSEKTPDSQVEVFQGATMTSVEPVMVEPDSEPEKTTMKPNLHKPSPPPPSQNPTPPPITSSATPASRPPSQRPSKPSQLGSANCKYVKRHVHIKLIKKHLPGNRGQHRCVGLRPDVPDFW